MNNIFRHILACIAGIATYLFLICFAKYIRWFISLIYASGGPDYRIGDFFAFFITMALIVSAADIAAMHIVPSRRYIPTIAVAVVSVGAMIMALTIGINSNMIGSLLGTLVANGVMITLSIISKDEKL